MTTRANRIHLRGPFQYDEAVAFAALSPGHMLEFYNDAGTKKVRKHSLAGGQSVRCWAEENALEGFRYGSTQPGGTSCDTAYAAGDLIPYLILGTGSWVSALLKGGVAYSIGDKLVSAGDGTLQKQSALNSLSNEAQIVAIVEEALDLSASAGVPAARGVVSIV